MSAPTSPARIGMVNFINTAPLYEVWRRTVARPEWRITEAVPSVLNKMLHEGALDLGFISSHEYALHPDKYRILDDISISATGAVGSVFLFSRKEIRELEGARILLSNQSQTSVYLVKVILEEFYGIEPDYIDGTISERSGGLDDYAAVLAIGDDALRLNGTDEFPHKLDLGLIWQEQTGLPFVFAVWAVREDFCRTSPETVAAIHLELLRCIIEGRRDLRTISSLVAPRIPMPAENCFRYLEGIEYDLGAAKKAGLKLFCEYLLKRGEASGGALPLRIATSPFGVV
ncbi:MAG: menaquinone biosynthesis protein [Desulfurivibrionaceae bacterium]|nr:menaquinone biosynthesis protein [Desulfurivibrionaceae bacterium]